MPSALIGSASFDTVRYYVSNYAVGYLFYPHRILRTLKSIFSKNTFAATVFEHRLKDLLKKKSSSESSVKESL